MNFIVVEIDPGIEPISGRKTLLLSNPSYLDVRDAFELSANRVQGRAIQSILYFAQFHHTVKIGKTVKSQEPLFGKLPLPPNAHIGRGNERSESGAAIRRPSRFDASAVSTACAHGEARPNSTAQRRPRATPSNPAPFLRDLLVQPSQASGRSCAEYRAPKPQAASALPHGFRGNSANPAFPGVQPTFRARTLDCPPKSGKTNRRGQVPQAFTHVGLLPHSAGSAITGATTACS